MYGPPFFFRVIPTYQGLPSLTIDIDRTHTVSHTLFAHAQLCIAHLNYPLKTVHCAYLYQKIIMIKIDR